MKRVSILIACAMIWLLPGTQAMASTWSWHSDFIERLLEILQDKANQEVRMERSSSLPANGKTTLPSSTLERRGSTEPTRR